MHEQSIFQLTTPMMLVLFACGFGMIYWQHRNVRSAMFLSMSFGIGALALIVDFFQSILPPAVGIFGTNIPYSICIMFFVAGVATRFGARVPKTFLLSVFAVSSAVLAWFTFVDPSILVRTHAANISVGFMLGGCALLLRHRKRNFLDTFIYGLLVLSCVQFMTRTAIVDYFWNVTTSVESYSTSPLALSLHLVVSFTSLAMAAALFVAMGMDIITTVEKKGETDGLTRLLNRRAFEEKAENKTREASESGLPLTLLVCDIDRFKRINDTYGHAAGDIVIQRFALALRDASRKSDVAGRIGGEEFCLLLPTANTELGLLLAQSIRTSFEAETYEELADCETLTASFGVAEMRRGESYSELFARADGALYRAKENGRDRVEMAEGRKRPRTKTDSPLESVA